MTKEKFIKEISDILGVGIEELNQNLTLDSFERWDSLSMLTMLDLYDEMGLDIEVDDVEACLTINDLLKLAIIK